METKEEFIRSAIRLIQRIAHQYARIEEMPLRFDEDGEVTTREAHIIQAIGEAAEMNVTGLANRFGITKSAASQMVSKLVRKGFVEKRPAPHSNKEFLLSLTERGRLVFDAHERLHGREMDELIVKLGTFSLSQIATLSVLLDVVGTTMDSRLSDSAEK
ncbi:MAG: MarR family transcriptional regulator [Geobacter sp.]|nr:MAG: MarR family transcriptional regulator [Geobacter sp.]